MSAEPISRPPWPGSAIHIDAPKQSLPQHRDASPCTMQATTPATTTISAQGTPARHRSLRRPPPTRSSYRSRRKQPRAAAATSTATPATVTAAALNQLPRPPLAHRTALPRSSRPIQPGRRRICAPQPPPPQRPATGGTYRGRAAAPAPTPTRQGKRGRTAAVPGVARASRVASGSGATGGTEGGG
ncbi:atherin-like [Panicum virgatum]|uniref:atherin-like n=1 Tax=Panicum virgatum TaxID=38727 RepID=UPI0019D66A24|nr:atherin-like [Panicum virgatum]